MDEALSPFKALAAAWCGGVMLGDEANDPAYADLVKVVVEDGDADGVIASRPILRKMIDTGREAVAYDLVFPEVFHPEGAPRRTGGFHAVLGNPPWDALQPLAKEFFAAFDLRVLDAPTRRERATVEEHLTEDPHVRKTHDVYLGEFTAAKRIIDRLYEHVGRQAGGRSSGAVTDLWQAFAERGIRLDREQGWVGYVLPSAFHANQSATGIRELYLKEAALQHCYSFENRKKLFDIHRSFKFATVVARRDNAGTEGFSCAYYLHDLEWLFAENDRMRYSLDFVEQTGGEYFSFMEMRSERDVEVAKRCFQSGEMFGGVCRKQHIRLGVEFDMSKSAHLFTSTTELLASDEDPRDPEVGQHLLHQGYLALHEGKTFHQYDDLWEERPRYLVHVDQIAGKANWANATRYYRLAFRAIARSTDEKTAIFAFLPPRVLFGNSSPCERTPEKRFNHEALMVMGISNSFPFDWTLRQKIAANVNLFILNGCPVPQAGSIVRDFLVHSALRLTCNHVAHAPLWMEQVGDEWREPTTKHTWPVLEGDDARLAMRGAADWGYPS